jgi:CHAT domain-containing protein/Flp pilus assembly protein TadD
MTIWKWDVIESVGPSVNESFEHGESAVRNSGIGLRRFGHRIPRRWIVAASLLLASLPLLGRIASATVTESCFGSGQASVGSSTAGQAERDIQQLELSKSIDHGLAEGERHLYQVTLAAGQFLHLLIESHGADLTAALVGPDRNSMMQLAVASGSSEPLFLVAKEKGVYRMEIRPEEGAAPGSYRVEIEELRVATFQDTNRALAQAAFANGERLRNQGSAESRRQAIENYGEALRLWRITGDRRGIAKALDELGSVCRDLGENQKALESLMEALSLVRAVADRALEGRTLHYLGRVYGSLGERRKALDYFNQALPLVRGLGARKEEAATLDDIGEVYYWLGEKQTALDYFHQVLPLARAARNRDEEASTLNNIGVIYYSSGEREKALGYYSQVLPLVRAAGDRDGEAQTLSNIGLAYSLLGERQKALDYYSQSLPLERAVGNRGGEARTLNNTGKVYDELGERQRALDYYNQALPLLREVGDRTAEANTLNNIGEVYASMGEGQKALEHYNQALALERNVGDRAGQAQTLDNVGRVYVLLGEKQRALDFYNQALQLYLALGNRDGEGRTLNYIGLVYASLGERQKALDHYNQALTLSRAVGYREGEAATLGDMASVERDRGNLVQALEHIEGAIKIIESLRTALLSGKLRASYFSTVQNNYSVYIDVLMRLHQLHPDDGNQAKALDASERARARSLLETLAEAQADIREGVDPALLERERGLKQLLKGKEAVQVDLLNHKHSEEQALALKNEIEEILARYEQVEGQIRAASPRYAALTQPQPLSAPEIQQQLDSNTLLLEYALGEERSFLWAVSPDSIQSFELPKRADLDVPARQFYDLLTARNLRLKFETHQQRLTRLARAEAQYPEAAASLSNTLLGPVAGLLKGKRLLIVGDGALQYIPFSALPEPLSDKITNPRRAPTINRESSAPLVVQHEIISLPSASALAVLRRETRGRQPAPKTVAVLADPVFDPQDSRVRRTVQSGESGVPGPEQRPGATRGQEASKTTSLSALLADDRLTRSASQVGLARGGELHFPRLAFTRREAEAILSVAPSGKGMMALDFNASLQTATDPVLSQYRIVHFATHGLLNSEHPELSGLVLSLVDPQGRRKDGFLQLRDIYNLNLPADLVVLSGCETGLGKEIRGEGLMGLTRGFLYAGAARLLVSLWDVHDQATAQLMSRFYRELLARGRTPAAALRAAQISIAKQGPWQSPYYWAAFVLQGEPN